MTLPLRAFDADCPGSADGIQAVDSCAADMRHAPEDFAVGDKIRILSGPFAEFVTRIDRIDPERRLTVLLDLLGGPTKVVLPAEGVIRQD